MATLQIENLPDELYRSLQKLATEKNVDLNETVIQMLAQAAGNGLYRQTTEQVEQNKQALADLDHFPRKNPKDYGLADSTQLIREDRDR